MRTTVFCCLVMSTSLTACAAKEAAPPGSPPEDTSSSLEKPDAATRSADAAGMVSVREPDPAVLALTEDTCEGASVGFRCPEGAGRSYCVDLRAFGVVSATCASGGMCAVCFRAGKTEADIACPPGTSLISPTFVVPNQYYCGTE